MNNWYSFAQQNLRDALDNMYDARVPALWRKVCLLVVSIVMSTPRH